MKRVISFIMAGGEGMRLWPMSRAHFPKQLHSLLGEGSMLQQSIRRLLTTTSAENILIGTREDLYFTIKDQWDNLNLGVAPWMILEPLSRNTAPAIALAILATRERFGGDVIMATFAADHVIKNKKRFDQLIQTGIQMAQKGSIVTFGIVPTYPETGYGYIKAGKKIESDVFAVSQFKEKPVLKTAQQYVKSGNYLWNSGMFIFDTELVANALENFSPEVWQTALAVWEKRKKKKDNIAFSESLFSKFSKISIDLAVMEKAKKLLVIKADFSWCDVGCWRMVHAISEKDKNGNVFSGNISSVDTTNTLVKSEKRFVATVGVHNLVIIDTPDALLVAEQGRSQDVKKIVDQLNLKRSSLTKFHTTVYRPWGNYTVLEEGPGYKIKRVVVNPKQKLSLQKHNHRSEHWVVISGKARIINDQNSILLKLNESVFIRKKGKHRISNPFSKELVIIEVQTGNRISEEDIVRFEDIYDRVIT